jgi:hypothetical protein
MPLVGLPCEVTCPGACILWSKKWSKKQTKVRASEHESQQGGQLNAKLTGKEARGGREWWVECGKTSARLSGCALMSADS